MKIAAIIKDSQLSLLLESFFSKYQFPFERYTLELFEAGIQDSEKSKDEMPLAKEQIPYILIIDWQSLREHTYDGKPTFKILNPFVKIIVLYANEDTARILNLVNEYRIFKIVPLPLNEEIMNRYIKEALHEVHESLQFQKSLYITKKHNKDLTQFAMFLEEKISERTHLLRNAKQEWERTFDAIIDPLAILDENYQILRANRAYSLLTKIPIKEITHKICHEILFQQDHPCKNCNMANSLKTGGSLTSELTHTQTSGNSHYRMWSFPLSDAGTTQKKMVVCYYKNVTDEISLHKKLLQTEKLASFGIFAGSIAHEINNPIGSILAFAQILKRKIKPEENFYEFIDDIEKSAWRCKNITDSMLTLARTPSKLSQSLVDIVEIVDESIEQVSVLAENQVIAFIKNFPREPILVLGDKQLLQQVFFNIAKNAAQAMIPVQNGKIQTVVQTQNETVFVKIIDNGVGMDKATLDQIFDPFFSTKPKGIGTGLGLTLCFRIIENHKGNIEVHSKKDEGSQFIISLPIAPSVAPSDQR